MTSLIRNNHILFFARLISLICDWSIPTIGFIEFIDDRCKQCIRTDIIKLTCNRSKNRKLLLVFMEEQVTAFILLAYLAKCILRATLFKLIDDDVISEFNYFNFLKLCMCLILLCHVVIRYF